MSFFFFLFGGGEYKIINPSQEARAVPLTLFGMALFYHLCLQLSSVTDNTYTPAVPLVYRFYHAPFPA